MIKIFKMTQITKQIKVLETIQKEYYMQIAFKVN